MMKLYRNLCKITKIINVTEYILTHKIFSRFHSFITKTWKIWWIYAFLSSLQTISHIWQIAWYSSKTIFICGYWLSKGSFQFYAINYFTTSANQYCHSDLKLFIILALIYFSHYILDIEYTLKHDNHIHILWPQI